MSEDASDIRPNSKDVGVNEAKFQAPSNLLHAPYEDRDIIEHLDPQEAERVRANITRIRERLLTEVPHDETGIDEERIRGFLTKYGLSTKPYLVVDLDGKAMFDRIFAEEEGIDITEEYVRRREEAHGSYSPMYDVMFAVRTQTGNPSLRIARTEADVVHEEAHASASYKDLAVYPPVAGKRNYEGLRGGFVVDDEGWFWEEGFAGMTRDKYTVEALNLPDGFSGRTTPIRTNVSGIELTVPARCISTTAPFEMDSPAFAAYGIQLLAAPEIR